MVNHANVARRLCLRREIFVLAILVLAFSGLPCSQAKILLSDTLQGAKIELSLVHQVLRGDILVVSGRISTTIDDRPIALVKIHLQYYRTEDSSFTREVMVITSNPSGRFEDRFNTTSLLRIGPWHVNASFPSQLGYQSTSAIESFAVVVQPSLSLYTSNHKISLGQSVAFDGFLFACIPCIQDEVTVVFSRPDNTSISMSERATPIGGPYPGGYYNGTFIPDVPGLWHIQTVWKGNEVSLSAYSTVETLNVEASPHGSELRAVSYVGLVGVAVGALILMVLLRRRHAHRGTGSLK
jgi:hypothetical protein